MPHSSKNSDPLLEVELSIARRADELVRQTTGKSSLNLQCWLLAEAELLGKYFDAINPFMPVTSVTPARTSR